MNQRILASLLTIGLGLPVATMVLGATQNNEHSVKNGHEVFMHLCAPCHGYGPGDDGRAMLPAPAALTIKYKGRLSPYLEERSDLPYPALKSFVRQGSWSMPGFRKTEITDSEIQDVALYLADSAQKKSGTKK